jgi:hypothetical protein
VYVVFAGMHSFRVAVICWQTNGPEQSAGLLHALVQTNGPLPIAMQRPPWHSMPASPSPVAVQHAPIAFVPSWKEEGGRHMKPPGGRQRPSVPGLGESQVKSNSSYWHGLCERQSSMHIFCPVPSSTQRRLRHSLSSVQQYPLGRAPCGPPPDPPEEDDEASLPELPLDEPPLELPDPDDDPPLLEDVPPPSPPAGAVLRSPHPASTRKKKSAWLRTSGL